MDERFSKQGMRRIVAQSSIFPLSKKEKQLSNKLLTPVISDLETEFEVLRNQFDKVIFSKRKKLKKGSNILEYPIGFCKEISSNVLMNLRGNFSNPKYVWFNAFKKFEKKGGIIKQIWGIQHEKYFQNVIVAGDYVIDVANDTVDINKPKVEINTIRNSGFRNIDSFEDYGNMVEKYWNDEVYPNIYFPQLAGIFPAILVRSWGVVELCGADQNLTFRNTLSEESEVHFQMSRDFLTQGKFAHKRLPIQIENLLYSSVVDSRVQSTKFKHMLEFSPGGDLSTTIAYLSQFKNLQEDFFSLEMNESIRNQCGVRNYVIKKDGNLILSKRDLEALVESGELVFN